MKIEISNGTYDYNERTGRVCSRTGKHIGTIADGTATWIRGGYSTEMEKIAAAIAAGPHTTATTTARRADEVYLQDGYYGTAADHARGYDGIE